jgi:alpha-2-macroglobulin
LKSGDLVEVELEIESKNDYEYLVFEDMKPAGFEPVDVRSGYTGNELNAYIEFRDERVVMFVRALARGRHSISYRTRAEIPGKFSALPTRVHAMYAPELRANSDEAKLGIEDQAP